MLDAKYCARLLCFAAPHYCKRFCVGNACRALPMFPACSNNENNCVPFTYCSGKCSTRRNTFVVGVSMKRNKDAHASGFLHCTASNECIDICSGKATNFKHFARVLPFRGRGTFGLEEFAVVADR